ncbi:MAG: glycerol-3-phosphate 1-O-acyltransferase PlsB [SAR86 cluster bacterium]|nr:glycerol-3-phosphate 1-O-acyltransferase PlsB [SAR86 cluster bacterium]
MLRFWIRDRFFSAVKYCVSPFISFEVEFEEGISEKDLNNPKTIYALPNKSVSELVALDKYTNKQNIASPIESFEETNLQRFIRLIPPKFDIGAQKIKRFLPENLPQILSLEDEKIILIPVSFYWGMHPDKQKSFFKIVFSQSWAVSGSFKKFFRVLLHGRSLVIKFNRPLTLSELKDKERTVEESSRLVSRYLRAIFRKTKKAAIGPDISHRRTLVRSLSRDKVVREEIKAQSNGDLKKKRRLNKKAFKYANEICSDINYPIVRNLQRGLGWFWNKRYDGIHLRNLDKIKSIADDNSLVYVPCHRSHIDYLALSYILLEKGLMLPHIAAGNNLNLPILGRIGKGGGAFFMRRSFRGNKLYSLIFFQYFRRLLQRGSSIKYFPEGGRSRSGFSLQAKPGLLSMTIRSFASLSNEKVKLIPTYIGYEKIIEGNSYLSELLGKEKKRENFLDLFKTIKDFGNFLGNAYINFGEPIDLKDFLEQEVALKDYRINSPLDRPIWLKKATHRLGIEVMKGINKSSVITTSSLFSLGLLTETTQTLDTKIISLRIELFIDLLKRNQNFKDVWLTEDSPEKIITKTEELGLIKSQLIGGERVFRPTRNEAALLSFYQNNISHFFLLYSLVCLSLKYVEELSEEEILRLTNLVYPFLQSDFYLPWTNEQVGKVVVNNLNILIELGLVVKKDKGLLTKPEKDSKEYRDFLALSNISEPSIKRFYIVMSTLWRGETDILELQDRCEAIANKLQEIEGWLYTEFSDASKFKSFITKLLDDRYIKENTNSKLSASRITKRVQKEFQQFFNQEFMNEVNRLNL